MALSIRWRQYPGIVAGHLTTWDHGSVWAWVVLSLGAADCVTFRKKESPGLRMYLNCICQLLFFIFAHVPFCICQLLFLYFHMYLFCICQLLFSYIYACTFFVFVSCCFLYLRMYLFCMCQLLFFYICACPLFCICQLLFSIFAHVPFFYLSVVVFYICTCTFFVFFSCCFFFVCAYTDPRWSGTWNPGQGWGQTRRNDDIHCICTEASCQTWEWLMQDYCGQKLIYLQPESWAPIGLMHASVKAQRSQGNISFEWVAWL